MVDCLTISPIFFLEKKEWYKTYCRIVLHNGNEWCMNEQRSELRIEKVHPPTLVDPVGFLARDSEESKNEFCCSLDTR